MKKQPSKKAIHEDTDEPMVIGILSVVILALTILTVSSYSEDTNELVTTPNLNSTTSTPIEVMEHEPFLINTNATTGKVAKKDIINM